MKICPFMQGRTKSKLYCDEGKVQDINYGYSEELGRCMAWKAEEKLNVSGEAKVIPGYCKLIDKEVING